MQMYFWEKDIADVKVDHHSRDEIPKLLMGLHHIYRTAPGGVIIFNILKQIVPIKNSATGRPGVDLRKVQGLGILRLLQPEQ